MENLLILLVTIPLTSVTLCFIGYKIEEEIDKKRKKNVKNNHK